MALARRVQEAEFEARIGESVWQTYSLVGGGESGVRSDYFPVADSVCVFQLCGGYPQRTQYFGHQKVVVVRSLVFEALQ